MIMIELNRVWYIENALLTMNEWPRSQNTHFEFYPRPMNFQHRMADQVFTLEVFAPRRMDSRWK